MCIHLYIKIQKMIDSLFLSSKRNSHTKKIIILLSTDKKKDSGVAFVIKTFIYGISDQL